MMNGLPEIVILLFGPFIGSFISAFIFLYDHFYVIYLWFANMGWFFKKNVNTNATSWAFRKLKTVGKSIYRYGIAGEMIVQLQQLNTFVNTSFNIALAQYVLDVKDELETTIQQIKVSADEAVKKAEEAINIVSIRQSITQVQDQIMKQDYNLDTHANGAGGRRTIKKRGEKKQKKQKFGKTRRTRT
jgi:hypothetical protein